MKRLRGWRPSLLTSFSLLGGVLTIVIAVVFALALARQLEQNALAQEAASAADQVSLILSPNLSAAELAAPLSAARYGEIDALIRRDVLHEHIVRVKIWNPQGQLLYSDDEALIGQVFPISDELEEALDGQVAMEVSSLDKSENVSEAAAYDRLLEVYVPIRPAGSTAVAGAYEIYHDLAALDPLIAATTRFVWLGVGLGFLLLYGALFALVRNASQALTHSNEQNKQLYEQEQTRRAELTALYDLSRALADAHDFDTTLALITRHAVDTIHVTLSRVALSENGEFIVRAAFPVRLLPDAQKLAEPDRLGHNPLFQRALEQDLPVVVASDNPELSDADRATLFVGLAETVCLMPLRAGGRALGLLMLGEARSPQREPFSAEKLHLVRSIGEQAASALYRLELFAQLESSYLQTVLALARAVDAKDNYTADHAQRLAQMATAIGGVLGLSRQALEDLRYGAILHDIGKIGVPDAVLQKPSKLDEAEWAQMRQHPAIGAGILAPIPHLAGAALVVRHHHERYDGRGYPDGLAGDAIPLGARILTVVDSYSAITDRRVYKVARPPHEAVAELRRHAGTQFDPRVVEIFLAQIPIPAQQPA
jgi:GAF domain-containing protein